MLSGPSADRAVRTTRMQIRARFSLMSPTRSAARFLSSPFRQAVGTALQSRRAPYPRRNAATGGGVRPPSAPLRNVQRGIRIEALAVRARRSCSSRSDLTPWRSLGGARPPCATPRPPPDASVAACAARSRPNGSATFSQPASRPHYFVALKQAKSPCRARQSTQAYPLARSASKCRATERRPGSWSLKTSGAATKSALRNRPPTDSNS